MIIKRKRLEKPAADTPIAVLVEVEVVEVVDTVPIVIWVEVDVVEVVDVLPIVIWENLGECADGCGGRCHR